MISYRIQANCKHTGEPQHVAVVHSKEELVEHCTAEWRTESVHTVSALQPGLPPRVFAVFVAGVCVSPALNDLRRS
jgi:hypothetical protein